MTNQMAIGFVTSAELHELCQGIATRLEKLAAHRRVAVEVGSEENIVYWDSCIEDAKSVQKKLLSAYSV